MHNFYSILFALSCLSSSFSLAAQGGFTNDDDLIDISTLDQLNAMRHDLTGYGGVEIKTPKNGPLGTFENPADGALNHAYIAAFPGGTYYTDRPSTMEATGEIQTDTEYFYRLGKNMRGYELINSLDFDDVDGNGSPSKWSKNCIEGCVTGLRADDTMGNTGWRTLWGGVGGATKRFYAVFDGNNFVIRNLYINKRHHFGTVEGFFGVLGSDCGAPRPFDCTELQIKDVYLTDINIEVTTRTNSAWVGGLAASINDTRTTQITNCHVTGTINSRTDQRAANIFSYAGGLVGQARAGVLISCSADVDVIAASGGESYTGGLVGLISGNDQMITDSFTAGDVTSSGPVGSTAGGLIGELRGSENRISFCAATGNVSSKDDAASGGTSSSAGGLMGTGNSEAIIGCYAKGNVSCFSRGFSSAGGLVGFARGPIRACYATGDVTSSAKEYSYAGGLVGYGSTIIASYATGNAKSSMLRGMVQGLQFPAATAAGGLTGASGSVTASYATGNAESSAALSDDPTVMSSAGGLLGQQLSSATITASYYDNSATITSDGTTSESGAKSTSELQTPTAAADIYETWDDHNLDNNLERGVDDGSKAGDSRPDLVWDFGSSEHYPALKVDFNGDGMATTAEFANSRMIPTAVLTQKENLIAIYPNPSSGWLRIIRGSVTENYSYAIYSINGTEKLRSRSLNSEVIDLHSLANGQYILILKSEDGFDLLRSSFFLVR